MVCNGTGDVTPPDEPEEEECQAPNGQTYTESCPAGQTGTITYTWNQSSCSYKETNNCTQAEEDCCSPNFRGNFAECVKNKYGENSPEYICYNGTAYQCGVAVFGGGSVASICMDTYTTGKQAELCKQCYEQVPEMSGFRAGGYHRYVCDGAPKKCSVSSSQNDSRYGCGEVYTAPRETFTYRDIVGRTDCLNKCDSRSQCPSNIQPGVLIHASHAGLDCWVQCYCPWSGYTGQTYTGYRVKLKYKSLNRQCSYDELTWM